jgi:hypothetical protein
MLIVVGELSVVDLNGEAGFEGFGPRPTIKVLL